MTKVKLSSNDLNFARFFDSVTETGIELFDISKHEYITEFFVGKDDLAKCLEISRKMCYTINVEETIGMGKFFNACKKHAFIFVGLIVGIILASCIYSRIWFIEIKASPRLYSVVSINLLQSGIKPKMTKGQINTKEIAARLERIDGVGTAEVRLDGCKLIVEIREVELEDDLKPHTVGSRIVANSDCKITDITVIAGKCMVKSGDIVKRGTVLVEGYEGEGTEYRKVVPRACIYGEVYFSETERFERVSSVRVRTGQILRHAKMEVGNSILWQTYPKIPYASYETVTKITHIDDLLIPLKRTEIQIYETSIETVERDFNDFREGIEQRLMKKCTERITKDCVETNRYVNVVERVKGESWQVVGVVCARKIVSI